MRTILVRAFGGPEVLRVEEVAAPTPGASEVLVRVRAAGVNPVDAYVRTGTYARKPDLPYTPGTDGAGEVEAVGGDVKGFKVGDRVYIAGDNAVATFSPGTYSEKTICRPTQLHPLPDRVTFGQGAAIGVPYGTAYRSLFIRAAARAGETVLVHGATGGVGIAAVELAHAHGMTVIGTGGSDRGLDGRARAWRGRGGQPQGPRLPGRRDAGHRRARRRRGARDGRAHQFGQRPHGPRAPRPHRRHRQPRTCRDRSARRDGQETRRSSG